MWALVFLLLFVVQCGWAIQCNVIVGPPGPTECIQLDRYNNEYQWATCLSNAYIQQKSGHEHICSSPYANYCWYQCMIEVHNKEYGSVTNDCSCQPGRIPTLSLPTECYSPAGDSCDWYRNCLEKKYPCEGSRNSYTVTFAKKFCRMFEELSAKFSADGQKWMDGVRKCLQVALVPLLRPWTNPTCSDIRERAIASHTPCYLKPDKDVPSICDLDYVQYVKIFWTIKGSFIKLDTAWQSLKGMWNVETECTLSKIQHTYESAKQTLKDVIKFFKIKIQKFEKRQRYNDYLPEADLQSRFADEVGSNLASSLQWNTNVMDWLAYTDAVFDLDSVDIFIVLADKKALGMVNTSAPSVDFYQTIQEFASAVKNGTPPVQVDGQKVWIKSLASCSDKSCKSTQTLAVSDEPPWSGATRISHGNVGLYGSMALLIVFMNKLLF